jgi:hypothetical protein
VRIRAVPRLAIRPKAVALGGRVLAEEREMRKLYRLNWDAGRMGSLDGLFVAEEEAVAAAIGKKVYFGEVLGKHSEVYGNLTASEVKAISDDQDFISKFKSIVGSIGYNPLDYIEESDEDDDDEAAVPRS